MALVKRRPLYTLLLPLLDGLTVTGSLIFAIIMRGRPFGGNFEFIGSSFHGEIVFLFAYGALSTLIFEYFSLYQVNVFTSVLEHTFQIVKALVFVIIGIAIISFFTKASFVVDSRLALMYFTGIAFSFMLVGRVIIFRFGFLFLTQHRLISRNTLIIGAGPVGQNVAVNIMVHPHLGLNVTGFLDDEVPIGSEVFHKTRVIGRVKELRDILPLYDVQEILVCLENVQQHRFIEVLEECILTDATVKVCSPLYDVIPSRLEMEKYGDVAVVGVSHVGPSTTFEIQKRIFDSVFAALGLLLLLPVFAAVALMIKLNSRGPVFFTQERIGRNGKSFRFFKFRSMRMGSDDHSREAQYARLISGAFQGATNENPMKIVDESRVTSIGRFLRKTSLDELPQLINVLKGDMSLVGPRPCLPYEWKHYDEWHKKRFNVMPGCTGMWQVLGRSQVSFQEMIILDLFYSQNISFRLDLWLIFKTIPVMMFGKGGK
jgi:exopolysaccharide biosynthesis polyprenyl glycosylphosphotransferase